MPSATCWPPYASVLREGERRSVEGEKLVPGDKVPADLRLVQTLGLQIQEAILTGESVPVEKSTEPVAGNAALGDRSCMAFFAVFADRAALDPAGKAASGDAAAGVLFDPLGAATDGAAGV